MKPQPEPIVSNISDLVKIVDDPLKYVAEICGTIKVNSRNKAKLRIALGATFFLLIYGQGTRNEIFAPIGDEDIKNHYLVKEGSAKRWQNEFLARLVDNELVMVQGPASNRVYRVDDREGIAILLNETLNDRPGIKAILWPSQYPELQDPPEDEHAEEEPPDDQREQELGNALVERLGQVAAHLTNILGVMERVETSLQKVDSLEARLNSLDTTISIAVETIEKNGNATLKEIASGIQELKTVANAQAKNSLGVIAASVSEILGRRKGLTNMLEAEGRKLEKVLGELKQETGE